MEQKKDLLLKYNRPGPRYTSYPPANFFNTSFTSTDYLAQIEQSNANGESNISIYIHIPFCTQRCHFCGCNTTLFENNNIVARYVTCLIKEINKVALLIDRSNRKVSQVHWGGGTPNSIDSKYITQVMDLLRSLFTFTKNAEIAIECNPAYLDVAEVNFLKSEGFNRISLGIQDFNTKVLDSVNRLHSKLPPAELIHIIREAGFTGINYDFIYGLPGQSIESFNDTIKKALELSPDRLVTFSYAHVPWVMNEQKNLEKLGLPTPEEKLLMFLWSMELIKESGYEQIGLDHYAKPTDDLAKALKDKKLHRNFQGYCTKETTGQVYGFGCSSISQLYGGYSQNEKALRKYMDNIENSGLAVERGYNLTFNDMVIKEVINETMCNGFLSFKDIGNKFNISDNDVKTIVDFKVNKFQEFVDDELIKITHDTIEVNRTGMLVVRNIAMVFDTQLNTDGDKYSKTI